jgi:hypothetical protein
MVRQLELVAPHPSGHLGHPSDLARVEREESLADQIEVGDAVDFVVIGDPGIAVAKAKFRADVEIDLVPAGCDGAMIGASRRPAVARIRPGDLLPAAGFGPGVFEGGDAAEDADPHRNAA